MEDSGPVNCQRRTRNEYEHFSAWRRMAILIPKILRYSFIQAANHKCGEFGCLALPFSRFRVNSSLRAGFARDLRSRCDMRI